MEELQIGDEIGYHGRVGIISEFDGSGAIVYFSDIDDEEYIEIDEILEQNS